MINSDNPEGPLDIDPTGKLVKIEPFQRGDCGPIGDCMPPEIPTSFERVMKDVFENFKDIFSCVRGPEDDDETGGL